MQSVSFLDSLQCFRDCVSLLYEAQNANKLRNLSAWLAFYKVLYLKLRLQFVLDFTAFLVHRGNASGQTLRTYVL